MAGNVSNNDIMNMSQDWGKDASNGLPYSGRAVQKFIKEKLNAKAGVFYNDTSNNRYLVFADEEARDEYLADPTQSGLILGAFDAPSNYTATIKLLSSNYNAILLGATGNYVEFTFDTLNKSDESVGEDVTCTYTIIRGGSKKTITERYRYGTQVKFNVDAYLEEGLNTVTIGIVGNNTLAATTVGVTFQVVNLQLTTTYNIGNVINLYTTPDAQIEIPFAISGTGTKTAEWYLDGIQLPFEQIDEVVDTMTNRVKFISMSGLTQGTHNIQARAYVVLNGEKFYSDTLYLGVIVYTAVNRDPIIGIKASIPLEHGIATNNLTLYGVEQNTPYTFGFSVYNPSGAASTNADVKVGGVSQGVVSTTNGQVVDYTLRIANEGQTTLAIVAGVTTFTANVVVEKMDAVIEENNNNLVLNLYSIGRTNSDKNKSEWTSGSYVTTFEGFQWNATSGWLDNRLVISDGAFISVNYAPFASREVTENGFTFEIEFATDKVNNESAVVCDLRNSSGKGLLITANEATLTSSGDALVTTKFKSGENIRLTFVVNPSSGVTDKGLVFIYIDGILSAATNYAANDNFLSDELLKIGGSNEVAVKLKHIRIYSAALSSDDVLNNFILYRDTAAEMMAAYDRNDIMDGRVVNLDALAAQCPVVKITGNIPVLENTTSKDETIYVDVEYVNMQDPTKSFTGTHMTMKPQGTSSMGYPKKNFRLYTRKHDDTKIFDYQGYEINNRLYSFKDGAQPVDCWCFKADYAESSGTHNTGIAKLWGKAMYDAQIDGEYKLRTNAQNIANASGYPYDVRTTIDGFPCHMVYRLNESSDWVYIGKYNFNNDKSTESVFGFTGIPGFNNSRMQCWEVLNNGNHLALFEDVTNFDSEWSEAYESRYPDTKTPDTADLKAFCQWVVSTKGNVAKFKAEKWNHLDVYKAAAYYIYVMRFGAVDQTVKNSMLTSEDGVHFYWINYDNDTINGLRNDGYLVFDYLVDRQSLDPTYAASEQVYAYAGHESTLWNNMEADDEFMAIVAQVDQALYTAGLKYTETIDMFDNEQSAKWCERVYNKDAQYKYVVPYNEKGTNNLFMLQGARRAHRRWWLSHRFDVIDSRFISGKFKANIVDFKVMNGTPSGQRFTIEAGNLLYYGYGVNDIPAETGVKLDKGEEYTFVTKQVLNIGDPVRIYSAQNLKKVDLSAMMSRLTQLSVTGVYDAENGSQLKELILGNGTSTNTGLAEISGLDQAKSLEVLDIRGMMSLNSVNIGSIQSLKTFLAEGSGLKSFAPADGAMLTTARLPNTLTALTLKGLAYLNSYTISGGTRNLSTIQISECPYLTTDFNYYLDWYNGKATEDKMCTLELDSVNWSNVVPADLIRLGQLKMNGGLLRLKGKCVITDSSEEIVAQLSEIFGSNCFESSAEFFITSGDAIYLTGPDEVLEGSSAQYTAAVFSEFQGKVEWSIISGGTSYQSIDKYGLLTTQYQGSARTITIQAVHTPTQGVITKVTKDVRIVKQIRPTGGTISGGDYASTGSEYTLSVSPSNINTEYSVSWSLSGTAYDEGSVSISSQNNDSCTLAVVGGRLGTFNVVATVTNIAGGTFTVTKSVQLGVALTIVMKSTQDNDATIAALSATVVSGGKTYTVANGGSVFVSSGAQVSITFPEVAKHLTPAPIEMIVGSESETITATYQYLGIISTETDLSMQDIFGASTSRNTANCYVVKTAGEYCFPLVYGNAIKNGAANTLAYTKVEGQYSHDFVNHLDNVITDPYIANNEGCMPHDAELSMCDTDLVFDNIGVAEGNGGKYIRFSVTNVPTTGANGVISVLDANGVVMWSWHIWVWPDDLTPVEITNNTGVNYNILPVNLATKKSTTAGKMYNWFYQWGRPTPTLLPQDYSSALNATNYGVKTFEVSSAKADTYGGGIQNPQMFYKSSSSPYNWFGSASYYNLWDANCVSTGNSDNDVVKTVYDPCPPGFKIPNGNTFTYFSKSNVVESFNNGWYFKRNAEDTTGVFFPASGCRNESDGSLGSVGSIGYVWFSSAYSQDRAYYLYFTSSIVNTQASRNRDYGSSVRPVQE